MLKPIEARVLAHRYLYHVLNAPVISNEEYDKLLRKAKISCDRSSIIYNHSPADRTDWPQEALDLAVWLTEDRHIIK